MFYYYFLFFLFFLFYYFFFRKCGNAKMPNTETGGIKGIAEPAFGGEHSEEEEEGEERDEKGDGEDGLRIAGIQFQPIQ